MADAGALIAVCGSADVVERGAGVRFDVEIAGERIGAFVIRYDGQVFGYLNRCAHVATELDWVAGHFFDADRELLVCATHGAAYDPASGACAGGPCAGRGALRRLQVHEDEGVVYWRPDAGARPPAAPRPG